MNVFRMAVSVARENWLVILVLLANLAIAAPAVASGWDNDVCYDGNRVIPCCSACSFFCSCGD